MRFLLKTEFVNNLKNKSFSRVTRKFLEISKNGIYLVMITIHEKKIYKNREKVFNF